MKKIQSVLCALALAISLSSTVLASNGIIVGDVKANDLTDVFSWGEITGALVSGFGILIGC